MQRCLFPEWSPARLDIYCFLQFIFDHFQPKLYLLINFLAAKIKTIYATTITIKLKKL